MNKQICTIAPLLRGMTHNGEKGDIVVFQDKLDAAEVTIQNPSADADELFSQLAAAFDSFEEANGLKPRSVAVEGVGGFLLGESYDAAITGAVEEAGSADRSAVVRNKVCVVTGGAQGFGEGIVRELVKAGSLTFIADMNVGGATALANELNDACGRTVALPVKVNVTDEESVRSMVEQIVRVAGGIDLFISNAGVLKAGSVKEISLRDFQFVTDVNYIGYYLCVKHVAPAMAMMNKPSGAYYTDIVQINSKSGLEGSNKNGAYAGSKFGAIGLTQSFAMELVEDCTKVNSICPGNFFDGPLWSDPDRGLFVQYLNTGKVPGAETVEDVRRFYEAKVPMNRGCYGEDVAKAIFYAVDQKYETGQAIPVTGGQVMLSS